MLRAAAAGGSLRRLLEDSDIEVRKAASRALDALEVPSGEAAR